jgi:hypothetical protein
MNFLIGGGALAVAGTSVIGSVATGVISSTGSILSYLWYGSSTNVQLRDYHRRLIKLDIPDKVRIIEKILENKEIETYSLAKLMEPGIRATTELILRQLSDINDQLEKHKEKWFNSYRNLSIDEELKDLESLVEVMDKKITLLVPQ